MISTDGAVSPTSANGAQKLRECSIPAGPTKEKSRCHGTMVASPGRGSLRCLRITENPSRKHGCGSPYTDAAIFRTLLLTSARRSDISVVEHANHELMVFQET